MPAVRTGASPTDSCWQQGSSGQPACPAAAFLPITSSHFTAAFGCSQAAACTCSGSSSVVPRFLGHLRGLQAPPRLLRLPQTRCTWYACLASRTRPCHAPACWTCAWVPQGAAAVRLLPAQPRMQLVSCQQQGHMCSATAAARQPTPSSSCGCQSSWQPELCTCGAGARGSSGSRPLRLLGPSGPPTLGNSRLLAAQLHTQLPRWEAGESTCQLLYSAGLSSVCCALHDCHVILTANQSSILSSHHLQSC